MRTAAAITPVGGSSGDTYVHIDRKSDLAKLIDVRIEKHDRSTALRAGRRLPGRGGGRLGLWRHGQQPRSAARDADDRP